MGVGHGFSVSTITTIITIIIKRQTAVPLSIVSYTTIILNRFIQLTNTMIGIFTISSLVVDVLTANPTLLLP